MSAEGPGRPRRTVAAIPALFLMCISAAALANPADAPLTAPLGLDGMPGAPLPPQPELEIRAELLPSRHATLSSEMASRIVRIAPREGHPFSDGETLVTFDCDLEEAQRVKARAILDAALASARINRRLSKLNATSKLEEQMALAEAAKAKADLAIIDVRIRRCTIQAPYAGRVVTRHAQPHQYVKAGDPLMEIHDLSSPEVAFVLPSSFLRRVRVGDRFQVRIDETGRSYPGRITAFGALIDAVSQSVKSFGEILGTYPELLPGMSGTVGIGSPGPSSP